MTTPVPQIYVSVEGGIAEATTTRGEAEIILIDWDAYDDDIPELDTIEYHMDLVSQIVDEDAWLTFFDKLTRAAGDGLERLNLEDRRYIKRQLKTHGKTLPSCATCRKYESRHYCQNLDNHPQPYPCTIGNGRYDMHLGHRYKITA